MYYSTVRNAGEVEILTNEEQVDRDMMYLKYLSSNGYELTRRSMFMRWFPNDLRELFEFSAQRKPIGKDFDGILSLISLAGIEFGDYLYFIKMRTEGYDKDGKIITKESQRNLSFLLFGTVVDDVSEVCVPRL